MEKIKKSGLEGSSKNFQEVNTSKMVLLPEAQIYKKIESLKPKHFQIFKKLAEYFSDEINHSSFYSEDQLWEIVGGTKDDVPIEDYLYDLDTQKCLNYVAMEGDPDLDEPDVMYGFYIDDLEIYLRILKNYTIERNSKN